MSFNGKAEDRAFSGIARRNRLQFAPLQHCGKTLRRGGIVVKTASSSAVASSEITHWCSDAALAVTIRLHMMTHADGQGSNLLGSQTPFFPALEAGVPDLKLSGPQTSEGLQKTTFSSPKAFIAEKNAF